MNLQKLIVWVSILRSMVLLDIILKTFSLVILMNSTLEHDMQVPTYFELSKQVNMIMLINKCNRHVLIYTS